ncbi:MAG: hypothetical protein IPK01_00770 [Acidobacteria bacterium]|nr:hypothetical protein [Acidobacteriota bacterium]
MTCSVARPFYNILENVIRNTAKHNQEKPPLTVFTVRFKTQASASSSSRSSEFDDSQSNLFYEVEIFDDIDKSNPVMDDDVTKREIDLLVLDQNRRLNDSVLDKDYKLRGSGLGLLEMEASAAYLRKLEVNQIEEDEYKITDDDEIHKGKHLKILKAFAKEVGSDGLKRWCLGYRFFLLKPTNFLLVSDVKFDEAYKKKLLLDGIWIRRFDDLITELKAGAVFSHEFVIFDNPSLDFEPTKNNRDDTLLPTRKIVVDKLHDSILKKEEYSFNAVEKWVWEERFNSIKGEFKNVEVIPNSYLARDNPPVGTYRILMLHHGDAWREPANCHHKEALSSNAISRLPGSNGPELPHYCRKVEHDRATKYKLFEAAICKIVVVDERIQRFADEKYVDGNLNRVIFEKTNVRIPSKALPLANRKL